MQLGADPTRGYLFDNLWVPKTCVNLEGVKKALTFPYFEGPKREMKELPLYREEPDHIVVPREFWKQGQFNFPVTDCRPRHYKRTGIKSRIKLDHKEQDDGSIIPTGDDVQERALQTLLASRSGILELGCVAGDTCLNLNRAGKGFSMSIAEAYRRFHGDLTTSGPKWQQDIPTFIRAKKGNRIGLHLVKDILFKGVKFTYKIRLTDGKELSLTSDHEVLSLTGFQSINDGLTVGDWVLADSGQEKWSKKGTSTRKAKPSYKRLNWYPSHPFVHKNSTRKGKSRVVLEEHRAIAEAQLNGLTLEVFRERCREGLVQELIFIDPNKFHVHHKDEDPSNNDPKNLEILPKDQHLAHHQPGAAAFGYGELVQRQIESIEEVGLEAVYDVVCDDPYHNFIANGIVVHNCGKGKTVIALEAIARLQTPALIIVDNMQLLSQWLRAIQKFLDVPGGVGLVGDGEFDWEGRFIVLATYQTLAAKIGSMDLPDKFRRWFGVGFYDEAHHVNAPTFSRSADLIFERRYGLTATPKRDDGLHVIHEFHFGSSFFRDLKQELRPRIYFYWTGLELDMTDPTTVANTHTVAGELNLSMLAVWFGQWQQRLQTILMQVRAAYKEGRKILVLSNSIDELINLLALWNGAPSLYTDIPQPPLLAGEVPPKELTVIERANLERELVRLRAVLNSPTTTTTTQTEVMGKIDHIEQEIAAHDTWRRVSRILRKEEQLYRDQLLAMPSDAGLMIHKVPTAERTRMLQEKAITFAVMKYGKEGLDEPSIDTIALCEPTSSRNAIQQIMGRALRRKQNKKTPVFMIFEDNISPILNMCKKMRMHLRKWPVEDGGPYPYEFVGYPNSARRLR